MFGVPYLVWRDGRPRWVPGASLRAKGFKGRDLKDAEGKWLDLEKAAAVARALNREAGTRATIELPLPEIKVTVPFVGTPESLLLKRLSLTNAVRRKTIPRTLPHAHYVYALGMGDQYIKLGFSTAPYKRWLSLSTMSPVALVPLLVARGTFQEEQHLHKIFAECRLKNEWYRRKGELQNWLAVLP